MPRRVFGTSRKRTYFFSAKILGDRKAILGERWGLFSATNGRINLGELKETLLASAAETFGSDVKTIALSALNRID
jgi:hypothetical protein